MSAIAALAKVIGGIIFILSLAGLIFASALAQFTEYDNLQPAITGIVLQGQTLPTEAEFSKMKADVAQHCLQTGEEYFNSADVFPGSPNATLRCADVAATASPQEFYDLAAIGFFDAIYYKKYACDFISCMTQLPEDEAPFVLISAHANSFFKQVLIWTAAGIVVGLALVAVAIRRPFGIAKAVGIEMIISGAVAYAGMSVIKGMVPVQAAQAATGVLAQLLNGLLSTLSNSFVIVLAIGIVLAVVGFAGLRLGKAGKEKKKK